MFTTAGAVPLITGASDGKATLAAVAAPWCSASVAIKKAIKDDLAARIFTMDYLRLVKQLAT
jgi:hypothetical protein